MRCCDALLQNGKARFLAKVNPSVHVAAAVVCPKRCDVSVEPFWAC
jgi:hypothetical protein